MYTYKPDRKEIEAALKWFAPSVSGRVLDVGGGSYRRYAHLFNFTEYITVDMEGADVKGDARALPFEDASFDAVICTQVVGDIFELDVVFKQLHRVLKPNGTLLLTECLFAPIDGIDYWRFTPMSLTELAVKAKFSTTGIITLGGYYSMMARFQLQRLIGWVNKNSRIQMGLFNRYAHFKSWVAWTKDMWFPDSRYANGYMLYARK